MLYDAVSDAEVQLIVTCPLPAAARTPVGAEGGEVVMKIAIMIASVTPVVETEPMAVVVLFGSYLVSIS